MKDLQTWIPLGCNQNKKILHIIAYCQFHHYQSTCLCLASSSRTSSFPSSQFYFEEDFSPFCSRTQIYLLHSSCSNKIHRFLSYKLTQSSDAPLKTLFSDLGGPSFFIFIDKKAILLELYRPMYQIYLVVYTSKPK